MMNIIGQPKTSLDTPALWVELDCMERNIAALAHYFRQAGVHWRPHTKGIKNPAIAHKLLAAGAIGVTCAKLSEAEMMAGAGIKDILVANQVTHPQKIVRLAHLCRQADVKVAVDHPDNVAAIGAAASQIGTEVGVVIEVNCGLDRAGVPPGEPTVQLARTIDDTPGLRFKGLMTWEGHALSVEGDEQKRQAIKESLVPVIDTIEQCKQADLPVEIVSAGGSGTFRTTASMAGITEIQAGGAIFCDVTYQKWGVGLEPALFVQSTVTSRPTPQRIIVDAGYKVLPPYHGSPRPIGVDHVERSWFSAEHGVVLLNQPNTTLRVGDPLDFLVGYGDATVYLHETMYGIRNGLVETAWPVLGRGKVQ